MHYIFRYLAARAIYDALRPRPRRRRRERRDEVYESDHPPMNARRADGGNQKFTAGLLLGFVMGALLASCVFAG